MTGRRKKILIGATVIAGLFAVAVAGALFSVKTDYAGRLIQERINSIIPGQIAFRDHMIGYSDGSVELTNVLVKDDKERTVLAVDRLFVRISLSELLDHRIAVRQIRIEGPQVRLVAEPDGSLNIVNAFAGEAKEEAPQPESPEKEGPAYNVVLDSFLLENGFVSFSDASNKTEANLTGIRLESSGDLEKQDWKIDLATGEGKYIDAVRSVLLSRLELSGALKKDRIENFRMEIDTASSALAVNGSGKDLFSEPFLDLVADLGIHLPEVLAMAPLDQDLSGDVKGSLTLEGRLANPKIALDLTHSGGALAGIETEAVKLQAELKEKVLRISDLEVLFPTGFLKAEGSSDLGGAFPEGFLSSPASFDNLTYDIALVADSLHLREVLGDRFAGQGLVDGSVSVKGGGVSPEKLAADVRLEVSGKDLTTGDLEPVDISIRSAARIDAGAVSVENLAVDAGPTTVSATGRFDWTNGKLDAKIEAISSSLAATLAPLGVAGVGGEIELRANATGSLERPVFDLFLSGRQLEAVQVHIGDLTVGASLDQSGALKISDLKLENQGSRIDGGGTVQIFDKGGDNSSFFDDIAKINADFPVQFTLSLQEVEAADFVKSAPVSGKVQGKLDVGGDLKDLKAEIDIQAKGLAAQEQRIGDIVLAGKLEDGVFSIGRAVVENKDSALRISGSVGIFEKNSLTPRDDIFLDLVLNAGLYVQDFTDAAKAKLSVDADVKGPASDPGGSFRIKGEQIDLKAQKLAGLDLTGELKKKKVHVDALDIVLPGGQSVNGSGWVSLEKEYSVRLSSEGVGLSSIDKVREQGVAEGTLVLDLQGRGSFDNPGLKGQAVVQDLVIDGKRLGNLRIDLQLADSVAKANASLDFLVDASYRLNDGEFSANLDFRDTDLAPYFDLAGLADFSGVVSGKVNASGKTSDIQNAKATGTFDVLEISLKDNPVARAQKFSIEFAERIAQVSGLHVLLLGEGFLDIEGSASMDGALSVSADGDVPLEGLKMVTDALPDISGKVKVAAKLQGTAEKPDISGEVLLEDVGFTIPELLQKLHDLNGRITISPDALRIEEIQGGLDSGRFDISGEMELSNFSPGKMKIDLAARALPVKVPDTLDILMQSDLTFAGTMEDSLLAGEVVILEGLYYRDIETSLVSVATEKKRSVSPQAREKPSPMLENMKLDLSIKRRNPFLVDNNLASLDVNPDLRISGTAATPSIRGRTTIEEGGTIRYQKNTFDVQKGVVDFVNPYELEPTLDIESTVEIRKWLITLTVSGTPSNLVFKLSSDPQEEDGDIISLLILGKTTRELIRGEGGSGQSAEQMVAEMLANTFSDDIKELTGLDYFELDASPEDESDSEPTGAKVTVGKNLSERLTVKYSADSRTGDMIQRAISEYKLLENIILSGFQDSEGVFGGEIQYRLEFR